VASCLVGVAGEVRSVAVQFFTLVDHLDESAAA
jgi:hypothetical protein